MRGIKLLGVILNDKFDKDKLDDKFDYYIVFMVIERRVVCVFSRLKNILFYRLEEVFWLCCYLIIFLLLLVWGEILRNWKL